MPREAVELSPYLNRAELQWVDDELLEPHGLRLARVQTLDSAGLVGRPGEGPLPAKFRRRQVHQTSH